MQQSNVLCVCVCVCIGTRAKFQKFGGSNHFFFYRHVRSRAKKSGKMWKRGANRDSRCWRLVDANELFEATTYADCSKSRHPLDRSCPLRTNEIAPTAGPDDRQQTLADPLRSSDVRFVRAQSSCRSGTCSCR